MHPPPVDTGRKLNVHKTFRGRPGHLLNVLCTLNLRPGSTGSPIALLFNLYITIVWLQALSSLLN